MSFFAELKQRKVFRAGAAYLVVAWLAVQVASIALPAFDAPAWAMRAFILVLALGFPLALMLSWAFELGPRGLHAAPGNGISRRLLAVCIVLAGAAVTWYFLAQPALQRQIAESERSIAVLPFVNLGGDRHNDYFSDGLAETTLDMLARVPSLKVIARSSSFSFRGDAIDVADVGRQLAVAHLLQGSVQQAGDRVRVSVQLVRAADGAQLWSQRFDRKITDVFAIQDEIAREVVAAIRVSLPEGGTETLTPGGTRNVAAYEAFLRGYKLLWTRQVADMTEAKAHFEKALALDPDYMQAKALALMAEQMIGSNTGMLRTEDSQRLKDGYDEVLARQPALAEAHVGRANVRQRLGDKEGALQDYRRGIELRPSFAVAHQWLAELLFYELDDVDGAVASFQRAMELDPITPQIRLAYARALVAQNRSNEALALLAEVQRKHPGNDNAAMDLSRLQLERGDVLGALRTLHRTANHGGDRQRMHLQNCLILLAALHPQASACVTAIPAQQASRPDAQMMHLLLALQRRDRNEVMNLLRAVGIPLEELEPSGLLALGETELVRRSLQRSAPGLLAQPATIRRLDVLIYPVAAQLLFDEGNAAQAKALLEQGLRQFAKAPGQGELARGWSDAIAHAMLGDDAAACAALKRNEAGGFLVFRSDLQIYPALAGFRDSDCYRQAMQAMQSQIDRQVAQARSEGLLPPGV